MIYVKRFEINDKTYWDDFINNAINGHFMFKRDYMEYHSDRFQDHSLLFEKKGKLIAVMPANQEGDKLISHGGLTFGGVISDSKMNSVLMLSIFKALKNYAIQVNLSKLIYKSIPYIYSSAPSEEDAYALFINNANLVRRDISTSILLSNRFLYSKGKKSNIKKGKKASLEVIERQDYSQFWQLLSQILKKYHGATPVHSLNEINSLAENFPQNIRLFEVRNTSDELLAGAVLYINAQVVHTQYLANSEKGRQVGALDFLIDRLLELFSDKNYFDFGISTVDQGRTLNEGLIAQKEGFGGRAIVHDHYKLEFE